MILLELEPRKPPLLTIRVGKAASGLSSSRAWSFPKCFSDLFLTSQILEKKINRLMTYPSS